MGAFVIRASGASAANPPCNVPQIANVILDAPLFCTGTNGIVVGASGITIDLNGFTISRTPTVGTAGILNNGGYDNVKITNGTINGFDGGIEIFNDADKNVIRGIDIRATNGDGILVCGGSDQLTIKDTSVVGGGNIGINIGDCTGLKLDNVESTSNVIGIHLGSVVSAKINNTVSSNARSADRDHGFGLLVDGASTGTTITKSSFVRNDRSGVVLNGIGVQQTVIKDVDAGGNGASGFVIDSPNGTIISKSSAVGNADAGVYVLDRTDSTAVTQSLISGNGGIGIVIEFGCTGTILGKLTVTGNKNGGISPTSDTLISSTVARGNGKVGISGLGANDGGKNNARGNNAPLQCEQVVCDRP